MKPDDVERVLSASTLPPTSPELERRVRDAARRHLPWKRRSGVLFAAAAVALFGLLTWWIVRPPRIVETPGRQETPAPPKVIARAESYEKVLETARKESKPVVCFIHRNDWRGNPETLGKALSELLGDLAARVVLAHANVQSDEKLPGAWKLNRQDGAVVVLDPVAKEARNQVIALLDKDDFTSASLRAFVGDALKTWTEFQASRQAFDALWAAWTKGDFDAFKAALWPAQVKQLGDEKLQKAFDEGKESLQKRDRFRHHSIAPEEPRPRQRELDPALEAMFRVTFVMVDKDGREDSSSMRAVRTGSKYYIESTK